MTVSRSVLRYAVCIVALALVQLPGREAWAQRTKAPTKKVAAPAATPSAAAASSATASRAKAVNAVSVKAVNAALRTALAKPAIKNAMRAEVLRQLRSQRPIAVVSGAWVTVIAMDQIYSAPAIRAELLTALGTTGPQLIGGASGALALGFTKISLGKLLMPDMVSGVESTIGVDALKNHMTEGILGDIVGNVIGGVDAMIDATQFFLGILEPLVEAAEDAARSADGYDPNADIDGDGIANWKDDDDDGDGVTDQKDAYPADKNKSICDCGRPLAMAFGTSVTTDLLRSIVNGVSASARAPRVALGALTGQTGNVAIVF